MNVILRKTHVPKYIDLLKARDYYFDIAKNLNLFKTVIVLMPSLFLLATYLLSMVGVELFTGWQEEIFIGGFTAVVAFAVYIVDIFIHRYTDISNRLRILYDHEVLGISYDPKIDRMERIDTYLEKAKKIPHSSKYEVWYSEVFSPNHNANVFCCQMDNLLYAKHAYQKAKRLYWTWLGLLIAVTIFGVACAWIAKAWITMFLVLFSVLECYDVCVGKLRSLQEAQEICTNFCQYAEDLQPHELTKEVIEQAQDAVNKNRSLCIFLPRVIRQQFLKAGNSFYVELDRYKAKFMGDKATIPETAKAIEVVFQDGSDAVSLQDIQKRLATMLHNVVRVLDEAGVTYTLDGGTLIGAKRLSTKGFIPWDDDIDLAIPVHQLERAKKALREQLDYVIQDADNEPYYSPRLSAFKIREQNEKSQIAEKDSQLWTEYAHHGLFIDVYALSPILVSKRVDALFRRLWIHPLNRRLERVENGKPCRNRNARFQRLKRCYCRRLAFYAKHAKNSKYYAYFPGYIYDLKQAGPYHAEAELYAESPCSAEWEKEMYPVPANPHAVLSAYYGDNWDISPYRTKKELVAKYGDKWYSQAPINVTALKHVGYLLSYSR